jgi:hypothetical protein
MPINKNINPYFDDYDQTKKYMEIMFTPGRPVQARELTQLQTILQKQVERFGTHIFKEGSMVIPGETALDLNYPYLRLNTQFNSNNIVASSFLNRKIIGRTSGAIATVLEAIAATPSDAPTLYLKYETGDSLKTFTASITSGSNVVSSISVLATKTIKVGSVITGTGIPTNTYVVSITNDTTIVLSSNATTTNATAALTSKTSGKFSSNEDIITLAVSGQSNFSATTTTTNTTGFGSNAQIKQGIYFANGYFCFVDTQKLMLEKYSATPSYRVGLRYIDSFVTAQNDETLLDPANGGSSSIGADRYKVDLVLSKYALDATVPDNFIELMQIKDGNILKQVTRPDYAELEKTLARRTFDESGNYTIRHFPIDIREHLNNGSNMGVYSAGDGGVETKLAVGIEPGKAYVRGYEIEKTSKTYLDVDKARDFTSVNNQIISTVMGNYVIVDNVEGAFNLTNYELVDLRETNKTGTVSGTARVKGFKYHSGTVGTTGCQYKLFLFDIKMNSGKVFNSDIKAITSGSNKVLIKLDIDNKANIYDASQNVSLIDLPDSTIKATSDVSYAISRYYTGTTTATSIVLTAGVNEIFRGFDNNNYHITNSAGAVVSTFTVTLGGSPVGKQVTINVPSITNGTVNIIAELSKSTSVEKTKTLATNTQTITHASTVQLGKSDIYQITSITDAVTSEVITDRYTLDNGQRDTYYDRGKLLFNSQYAAPTGNIVVVYSYFNHGSGDYFSVNSYNGVIDYKDIPLYTSTSNGRVYDLANVMDFRPRINDDGSDFSVRSELIKDGEEVRIDYDLYLPRIDKIVLSDSGEFSVIKGVSALNPLPPKEHDDTMVLYNVVIPAYTYSPKDVRVSLVDNKRYTMRDIGKLEKRLENLEFYTSLSLLEKETSDLFIDDGTGNNRFKNGFIVDNFTTHNVGDSADKNYICSINPINGELRPSFNETLVSLDLNTGLSSSYVKTGSLVTLPFTHATLIEQKFASTTVNVNPYNIFNWVGSLILTPPGDEWIDTVNAPDRIIENTSAFDDSFSQFNGRTIWNEWQNSWLGNVISEQTLNSTTSLEWRNSRDRRNVTTTNQLVTRQVGQSRSGVRVTVVPNTQREVIGDRIVDVQTIPFIRSRDIAFVCANLKPNTRVYPFFDNTPISQYCKPTGGALNDPLITDNNGKVEGTFNIPNSSTIRFRTGRRIFKLADSATNDANFITTSSEIAYLAQGTLQTRENTVLSTTVPQIVQTNVSENRVTVGTDIQQRTTTGNWFDPLAQTFLIDTQGGVFLSKIDIYFASKDSSGVPVTLQIRNVVNGYPGQVIVPFSEVSLNPSSVNTSVNGTTATSFVFTSPVYLEDKTEYCFVLLANSNEYNIWTSKIGEFDIATGERISQQPYAGVMFKSQNASTWTAEQEQDIKFKVHRCVFNTSTAATVIFENKAIQALTLTKDPLYTTGTTVTVNVPNHGLNVGDIIVIAGVSGTQNGIPASEINGNKTITAITFDTVTFVSTTTATKVGSCGGTTVTAITNIRMDLANIISQNLSFPNTSLDWEIKTSNELGDLESSYVNVVASQNLEFLSSKRVVSTVNEGGSKSLFIRATLNSDVDTLSPVIDTSRLSVLSVNNRINALTTNETNAGDGLAMARYFTKKITLNDPATMARVYFSAIRPANADIKVYIKYQTDDNQEVEFKSLPYVELTKVVFPLSDGFEYKDYTFELDNLNSFSVFSIKIVMTSLTTTDVPKIKDFRTIALA